MSTNPTIGPSFSPPESYPIPFLLPALPERRRLEHYLDRVYQSRWLSNSGPLVRELEARLEEYLQVKYAVAVASATAGLMVAWRALALPSGSEVVMPSFTFAATPQAALWNNLCPRFADIDVDDLCLSAEAIRDLNDETIRAIMPVTSFGLLCDNQALEQISEKKDWLCLYDAAPAVAGRRRGRPAAKGGLAAVLSLHATKILSAAEGGVILTDDERFGAECRRLINFGFNPQKEPEALGLNGKMSELNAALALAGFDAIEETIARRKEVAEHYRQLLAGSPIALPRVREDTEPVLSMFPIFLPAGKDPEAVRRRLGESGIETRRYFSPLHRFSQFAAYAKAALPGTEAVAARILCLPFYSNLTAAEQEAVVRKLARILETS
jgi:dTDP-4-amino-4,6-dideoxygalactose transaminase